MSVFQILILFQELDNLNKPFVLRFSILLFNLNLFEIILYPIIGKNKRLNYNYATIKYF